MKEHPTLFSSAMVRAIMEGRESQTRRVLTRTNSTVDGYGWNAKSWGELDFSGDLRKDGNPTGPTSFGCGQYLHVPRASDDTVHRVRYRIEPGDHLWVREAFIHYPAEYEYSISASVPYSKEETIYRADVDPSGESVGAGWRPSIHMPRWASRLTLEVTEVRVQRVREISEEDARAEGVESISQFASVWDSINQARGYPWSANPWVFAVTFVPVHHS